MSILQQKNNWLVALLLVLNVATLTTVWLRGRSDDRPKRLGDVFQDELGISDAQVEQVEQLARTHRQKMEGFEQRLRTQNERLFTALGQPTPDSTTAAAAIDSILAARRDMETARARFFLELKGQCTPEQQAHLAEVFARVARRPPPPPGRR